MKIQKQQIPSTFTLRELVTDQTILSLPTLLEVEPIAPENQRNVPPATHKDHFNPVDYGTIPDFTEDELIFESQYVFEVDGQNPGQFPAVERKAHRSSPNYLLQLFCL